MAEVGLVLHSRRDDRQRRVLAEAHLQAKAPGRVPKVAVQDVSTERRVVIRLVILVEGEGDAVVIAVEDIDEIREHLVVRLIAGNREVEIFGEATCGAEEQLAQTGTALESQMPSNAGIEQSAKSVGQNHVTLGDKLVTQAAVACVEVDELVRDHRILLPS